MRNRSILLIHQVSSGTKRGGHSPYMREGSAPSPCNCKTPCCYGKGRNFCWPCIKKMINAHNTGMEE